MRLNELLSKEYTAEYTQVEGFVKKKLSYGVPRKIEVGKIALNCKCLKCNDVRTFISPEKLQIILIHEDMFSVDTSLECSMCGERVAAWFLVDSEGMIEIPAPKLRIIKRSIKYSDFVKPAYNYDEKYGMLLENAEIAFREGLGAGAIVYLRKIFEMVTDGIADAESINVCTDKGKKKPFSQRLDLVKAKVDFIPKEFSDDGYRLFGELSDVVHGEFDEEEGLKKYQTLKRLVVGVLDNIKNRAEFAEARAKLGWNEEEV